ncbi:MAG: ABC transporter ATP-binding protein [Clostridia bacterium]|nr:ABC transporter ATP-binding protein [Clostridia bacterium]
MIKRFIKYYKPEKRLFAADMACAFLLAACDLIYPEITKSMLEDYIPNGKLRMLFILAGVLLLIYVIKYLLNYFVQYYGHMVGVRMQAAMRRDVFDHLQKLPLSYFDSNKTGTIMSRIINDLMDVSELAHHGPEDLFLSLVMLVGAFVLMSRMCLPLTLILYAFLPILIFFAAKQRRKMSDAFTRSRKEVGEINANLENSVSGIRVSKAFDSREEENKRFAEGNDRFVDARRGAYKAMAQFHGGTTFITDFLMLVMYLAGGLFFFYDYIDLPEFTAFVLYINVFTSPIRRLIGFVEQYQNGMTGFKRFIEIMDTPAEADGADAVDIAGVKGKLEFKNVSFSYEDGKAVLDGLSFTVEAGRTLALVGPSGGGKTTICHLIPRFYPLNEGSIELDGKDIRDIHLSSLRDKIGIVAQDVFLFNSTIYENIAYGNPNATRTEVEEAAKRANIHDYVLTLEKGYDTVVGERGVKLSGGQKQRISIARAFLKNPPIMILDEATSALDNATEHLIQNSLDELCKGRTTIVVAHRLTTVKNADEILVITDEGIAERGNHEELVAKNGIYAELWKGYNENR